jgi:hypothetical protein
VLHSVTSKLTDHLQPPIRANTDDLVLVTNTELTQPGQQKLASSVGEPSMAVAGDVVMYTGNWYAARSIDAGQTFQYIDPFTTFPDPPNQGFCCDQVVNYLPTIDTFVWLMQYGPKTGPQADNIQRLALATSDQVRSGNWHTFDITTQNLGVAGQFMDFPDLAVGTNTLYVTTNLFTPDGQGAGAAVVRIPIGSINSGPITVTAFVSPDLNSFRVAQNCQTTAYFATHADTSTLKVFTWDEAQSQPSQQDVGVSPWVGTRGYNSSTPDGQHWLDRIDPRLTGATLAGTELWFCWSVDSGSNQRTNPFVQVARIDSTNITLLENINVFDLNDAIAYGALSSNSNAEVGISYMIGGQKQFPSHMVGILTGTRRDLPTSSGERGPADGQWGDFLTMRPVFPDRNRFAATGYTMKGTADGSNRDATPRYVVFARSGDVTPGPGPGPTDGGPITDVNTLPVVSASVAAQIKAACQSPGARPAAAPSGATPPIEADTPGSERWPVKTGQDPDRVKVGKNVVNGTNLGAGIVETTIEELIALPRPNGLTDPTKGPPAFRSVRANLTECTIWRIQATIIALKHENDGDYHLVLQSPSGAMMVAEIPTPTTVFVGDSTWLANIEAARQQVDDKLVKHLSPAAFGLWNGKYVPLAALSFQRIQAAPPGLRFDTPPKGSTTVQPLFATSISPTAVRLTGVGFFDRAHGATGAAPNVIELHPVLLVEWT